MLSVLINIHIFFIFPQKMKGPERGPEGGPEGGSRRGGPGFVYTPLHFVSRPKNNLEKIITVCQDSFLTR